MAEYTTDADFSIGPADLADSPLLAELMEAGGFVAGKQPGAWLSPDGTAVDLMVLEALAGPGSRGARLGPHGQRVARRAKGLEGALVDRDRIAVSALDPADGRVVSMLVGGPAALLVAKVHKISERVEAADRLRDMDALDVFWLLQATSTPDLARRMTSARDDEVAGDVAEGAVAQLDLLMGRPDAVAIEVAIRASGIGADSTSIGVSFVTLTRDLLSELDN